LAAYADSQILYDDIDLASYTKTWKYSPSLRAYKDKIDFACLLIPGTSISEYEPSVFGLEWGRVNNRMSAFQRSLINAQVDPNDVCLFQVIPEKIIIKYLKMKNEIIKEIFDNHVRIKNHEHLKKIHILTEEIKNHGIIYENKVKNINYDMFKSRTGRLATKTRTFNILNLNSDNRHKLKPLNDFFVELDFNGAEIRTLLALSGKDQPPEDIHSWNLENVYKGLSTRKEAKERFFAWLYNPNSTDCALEEVYNKEIYREYWDGEVITTTYDREIESDEYHALNYLIQSTSSDLCLEQAYKVFEFLEDKKTKISFTMHDSVVLDLHESEKSLVLEILDIFRQTRFGSYKTNLKIGKDFGNMRNVKC